jgi:hypothetical protein
MLYDRISKQTSTEEQTKTQGETFREKQSNAQETCCNGDARWSAEACGSYTFWRRIPTSMATTMKNDESDEIAKPSESVLEVPKGNDGATSPPDDDTQWDLPRGVSADPSPTM